MPQCVSDSFPEVTHHQFHKILSVRVSPTQCWGDYTWTGTSKLGLLEAILDAGYHNIYDINSTYSDVGPLCSAQLEQPCMSAISSHIEQYTVFLKKTFSISLSNKLVW